MNILIITGGSKGIGKAIAKKFSSKNFEVYSLARSKSNIKNVIDISLDLTNLNQVENSFNTLFKKFNGNDIRSITLINNAGRLGEISSLGNLNTKDINLSITLNTTTPLVLANLFIKNTKKWNCKKQIISISSGAARTPYEGWSIYCSSKAAIDMMTKTIALEQDTEDQKLKCVAIYPGVVDTNMQSQIRNTSENNFKNVARFINLKENNELYTTDYVASKIYNISQKELFNNGDIIDIRN